jgi:hypothetical protein
MCAFLDSLIVDLYLLFLFDAKDDFKSSGKHFL